MIKLKVEWHRECPSCGTELVTDFFDKQNGQSAVCPWCGCATEKTSITDDSGLKDYIRDAVKNIEEEANDRKVAP